MERVALAGLCIVPTVTLTGTAPYYCTVAGTPMFTVTGNTGFG